MFLATTVCDINNSELLLDIRSFQTVCDSITENIAKYSETGWITYLDAQACEPDDP